MDNRLVGLIQLRISRKQLSTSSVSGQARTFGGKKGKLREARVMARFYTADVPQPITHGLGFVPTSFQAMPLRGLIGGAAPGVVYSDVPLNADRNVIVLRCSVANTTAEVLVR